MGYRITYQTSGLMEKKSIKNGRIRFLVLSISGAAILSYIIWTNRGEWHTVIPALENMAAELEQGSNVKAAFTTFCLQVLHGG